MLSGAWTGSTEFRTSEDYIEDINDKENEKTNTSITWVDLSSARTPRRTSCPAERSIIFALAPATPKRFESRNKLPKQDRRKASASGQL